MGDVGDFGALLRAAALVLRDDADGWERFLKALPPPVLRRIADDFFAWQAHGGQSVPAGDWTVWLLMAGRGFGKTRAGAEWVSARAREHPGAAIALVGGSRDEVAKVMVEGPSGLLAVARSDEAPVWVPTQGVVRFSSGAQAFVYSAEAPEKLRGPEHHFAWCDELAKWAPSTGSGQGRADATWDNLMMGMRVGERPRVMVTTTPRPVPLVRRVKGLAGCEETRGRTEENAHLSQAFKAWVVETYGGTRLGRQELDGMLIEDVAGSLFPREVLEASRVLDCARTEREMARVVVGVDPPASADGDACGIVACGLGRDGAAYVLSDCSVRGLRPEGWARAVARAAEAWGASLVVAEKNQGGEMVGSVLRQADAMLPVKLVSASRGKGARAEPVAARFETGKVKLAGRFPELEDELAAMTAEGYGGAGSPDRADACVWAISELIRPAAEPRIRVF
jgi:predicted phage terminase large subunit-like protein